MRHIKGSTGKKTYWVSGGKAIHKPRLRVAPSKATTRQMTEEEVEEFLAPRRKEDEGDSLWVVLNRIQESVMKGGYHVVNAKGKLRKAKSIKNIQKDIQLNQQIWELGMQYA